MSYAIGNRINTIRSKKKISQEDIASVLGISRQRFARIENGQSEASYYMIKKIADCLSVSVSDITSADENVDLRLCFREAGNSEEINDSVDKIIDILKTFHAHEKLYYRMKGKEDEI
jgi:transcriptional regulator with XRE-family HTH domain